MRTQTTDWNNGAYASATVYVDRQSGNSLSIGANRPHDVRAMELEVAQGNYTANPASIAGGNDINQAASYTQTCTTGVPYAAVKASSANTGVVTVPALTLANASGVASIRYTKVAAGGPVNVTLTCGTRTDTVAVTFT